MTHEWITADWPAPDDVIAGSTLRGGGVSEGVYRSLNLGAHVGDDPAAVAENRRRYLEMCALEHEPGWLTQVHGTDVHIAGKGRAGNADAVIGSAEPVAVLTADCLPILLCARSGDEYAAIHAGWRGLAAGIVNATVSKMRNGPEQLIAWLGAGNLKGRIRSWRRGPRGVPRAGCSSGSLLRAKRSGPLGRPISTRSHASSSRPHV